MRNRVSGARRGGRPFIAPFFLCLAALSLAAWGCSRGGADLGKDVLALVDGDPITVEEFRAEAAGEIPVKFQARRDLLGTMVNERLAAREGVQAGMLADPAVVSEIERFYVETLPDYLKKRVASGIKTDESDVDLMRTELRPSLTLSMILSKSLADAQAARGELVRGRPFDEVVRKYSPMGGGVKEVDLADGTYPAGVRAALNGLKPGGISPVLKMEVGYLVARLDNRVEPDEKWKRRKPELLEELKQRRTEAEVNALIDRLRTAAKVTVKKTAGPDGEEVYTGAVVDTMTINIDPESFKGGGGPHEPHSGLNIKTVKDSLNRTINNYLLSKEARRQGVQYDPDFQRRLDAQKRAIIARVYIDKVKGKYDPTPEEQREYYEKNREKFTVPTQVRLCRILLRTDGDARAAMAELRSGKDFTEVVRKMSVDENSRKNDGDVGFVLVDTLKPYLKAEIGKLRPGETSGVIKSDYGYEILKAIDRKEGVTPFDKLGDTIKKRVVLWKQTDRLRDFYDALYKKSVIKYNEELLKSLR